MKRLFLYVALLFFSLLNAQENGYHISLKNKKNKAANFDFFIDKIYDARQYTDMGLIKPNKLSAKQKVFFKKPFQEELQDYFNVVYPKAEGKRPISIRIYDLYIFELNDSELTPGAAGLIPVPGSSGVAMGFGGAPMQRLQSSQATIVFEIIEEIEGKQTVVGTFNETVSGEMKPNATSEHDNNIRELFRKGMNSYANRTEKKKKNIPFESFSAFQATSLKLPKKGIYASYLQMISNTPVDTSYYSKVIKERTFLFSGETRVPLAGYFGFSDGSNFYLNVGRYSGQNYYCKAELMGNSLFVPGLIVDDGDESNFKIYLSIGAVPLIYDRGNYPFILNLETGALTYLSKSEVKKILEPFPDLREKFIDGNRTPDEIKGIISEAAARGGKI